MCCRFLWKVSGPFKAYIPSAHTWTTSPNNSFRTGCFLLYMRQTKDLALVERRLCKMKISFAVLQGILYQNLSSPLRYTRFIISRSLLSTCLCQALNIIYSFYADFKPDGIWAFSMHVLATEEKANIIVDSVNVHTHTTINSPFSYAGSPTLVERDCSYMSASRAVVHMKKETLANYRTFIL